MTNMAEAAQGRGATAVVAVRLDHRDVGESWVEICAYGTAVITETVVRQPAEQGKSSVKEA